MTRMQERPLYPGPSPWKDEAMRFLLRLIINAFALWLTTLIVSGVSVRPYASGTTAAVLTFLLIALIFGIVNAVIGTIIRIVALPLYILTLGLISLIVNAFLLLIVSWISGAMGFGLFVAGFWWGVLGALVLGVIAWLLGLLVRPTRRT